MRGVSWLKLGVSTYEVVEARFSRREEQADGGG